MKNQVNQVAMNSVAEWLSQQAHSRKASVDISTRSQTKDIPDHPGDDDSTPVGGHLLNHLRDQGHWTKHTAVQTLPRDLQCICFPSLTVWDRRHIHWKIVIQLCCKQIQPRLMPAMGHSDSKPIQFESPCLL